MKNFLKKRPVSVEQAADTTTPVDGIDLAPFGGLDEAVAFAAVTDQGDFAAMYDPEDSSFMPTPVVGASPYVALPAHEGVVEPVLGPIRTDVAPVPVGGVPVPVDAAAVHDTSGAVDTVTAPVVEPGQDGGAVVGTLRDEGFDTGEFVLDVSVHAFTADVIEEAIRQSGDLSVLDWAALSLPTVPSVSLYDQTLALFGVSHHGDAADDVLAEALALIAPAVAVAPATPVIEAASPEVITATTPGDPGVEAVSVSDVAAVTAPVSAALACVEDDPLLALLAAAAASPAAPESEELPEAAPALVVVSAPVHQQAEVLGDDDATRTVTESADSAEVHAFPTLPPLPPFAAHM